MNAHDFISGMANVACIQPLGADCLASKEKLLGAEVALPIKPDRDPADLRVTQLRPPFGRQSRLVVVDVSRLSVA